MQFTIAVRTHPIFGLKPRNYPMPGNSQCALRKFFGGLVRYTVLVFTVLAMLDQFGVQTASLLAVFGAGALAIGLALQGTLSNVAAGVMLLCQRKNAGSRIAVAVEFITPVPGAALLMPP